MRGEVRDERCDLKVLVCFALKEEAAPFRKMAMGKPGLSVLITGIGRRNAEKSVRDFLAASSPELVLTCGFAGGLNPDLKLGDVVFEVAAPLAPSLSPPGGERVSARTGEGLIEKLSSTGAQPVKFFCADRIATTVAEKKKLRGETGADVVEMESAVIHAVCRERRIPCATVRVISDTANEDLPLDFNVLAKPDQSLNYGKLFLAIARSPGKIGALMQLQKQARFAAEKLAEVLAKTIR
jgi:adenosylhomocysteine nucleosidase